LDRFLLACYHLPVEIMIANKKIIAKAKVSSPTKSVFLKL